MKRTLICFLYLTVLYLWPKDVYSQTARDTALVKRARIALDSADSWRVGQQPTWLQRQWRILRAAHDSLLMTVGPVPPPVNQAPVARFSASCVPLTRSCSVNAGASTDDKAVTGFAWTFGDGATASTVTAAHTYALPGSYQIRLTVRDLEGLTSTRDTTVTFAPPVIDSVVPSPTNKAPAATFSRSCASATRLCAVNASASTDDGGTAALRFSWGWGDGQSSTGVTATHQYAAPGSYQIRLTATDAGGLTATATQTITLTAADPVPDSTLGVVAAAEPRATPAFTVTAAARTVRATTDLQAALSAAQPGDSIVLPKGARYVGNYRIPAVCGAQWVTVTTEGAGAIPAGRITPAVAAAHALAQIVTPNTDALLQTAGAACKWRFVGLEWTSTPDAAPRGVRINYGMVTFGSASATTVSQQPTDILIDRVYLHGHRDLNSTRCLTLNTGATIVRDSWISDCHAEGNDSQAILGYNGPGPHLIENNFLAGAGENVMYGGADPTIVGLRPGDITLRRNHVYKDPAWKGVWTIKNLFELKNAQRVLVEGNVFENNWAGGHGGTAWVVKSSVDACNLCRWQGSTDVTFRYNIVRNAGRGVNLQAVDDAIAGTGTDVHVARVAMEHNLFTGIGTSNGVVGDGWLVFLTGDLTDVLIRRNTFVGNTPGLGLAVFMARGGMRNIRIPDNVFAGQGDYAIGADGIAAGTTAFTAMAGSAWTFAGNAVSRVASDLVARHPVGNVYLDAVAKLGLTSSFASTVYPTKGVDVAELQRRTAGVVLSP